MVNTEITTKVRKINSRLTVRHMKVVIKDLGSWNVILFGKFYVALNVFMLKTNQFTCVRESKMKGSGSFTLLYFTIYKSSLSVTWNQIHELHPPAVWVFILISNLAISSVLSSFRETNFILSFDKNIQRERWMYITYYAVCLLSANHMSFCF